VEDVGVVSKQLELLAGHDMGAINTIRAANDNIAACKLRVVEPGVMG
jgi:hypothetical protein